MLNDSKIAQLNSERPLHQTAVIIKVLIRIESNCQINSDMSRETERERSVALLCKSARY